MFHIINKLLILTCAILFFYIFTYPLWTCVSNQNIGLSNLFVTDPSLHNPYGIDYGKSTFLLISNSQQEGVTKVLHQGTFGRAQNIYNDTYYALIYSVTLFWARVMHYGWIPQFYHFLLHDAVLFSVKQFLSIPSRICQVLEHTSIGPNIVHYTGPIIDRAVKYAGKYEQTIRKGLQKLEQVMYKCSGATMNSSPPSINNQTSRELSIFSLFLGNQFSSEHLYDDQYREQVKRWNKIFPFHRDVEKIYIAGNSDIGYGYSLTPYRLTRFVAEFGNQNVVKNIRGVQFVFPLSLSLDGSNPSIMNETWSFLEHFAQSRQMEIEPQIHIGSQESNIFHRSPLVLVTHLPLYKEMNTGSNERPNQKSNKCEPFYYKSAFDNKTKRQSQLSKETSLKLLQMLKPDLIISGHDYNGCEYIHEWSAGQLNFKTKEIVQRSIKGDFGGHVGFLTVTRKRIEMNNNESQNVDKFEYSYKTCGFIQTKNILIISSMFIVTIVLNAVLCVYRTFRSCCRRMGKSKKTLKEKTE